MKKRVWVRINGHVHRLRPREYIPIDEFKWMFGIPLTDTLYRIWRGGTEGPRTYRGPQVIRVQGRFVATRRYSDFFSSPNNNVQEIPEDLHLKGAFLKKVRRYEARRAQ